MRSTKNFKSVLIRVLLYPWLFWDLCGLLPVRWRLNLALLGGWGRALRLSLHLFIFLLVGFPLTVFISGELLIHANELLLGEQAKFHFDSSQVDWTSDEKVTIPGPLTPDLKPVTPGRSEAYDRYLVELFSPVVLQKLGHHPKWDIPVFLDYDGDEDPRNNLINEPRFRPQRAGLHGEMTAETDDSYYLLYCLFHLKDYDHPIRELLSDWTYHDNDDEGFMVRVDKKTMKIVEGEGWYHNLFFLANLTGRSKGSEPVQGKLFFEKETHPVVFGQSMGHGVRFAEIYDFDDLQTNLKILRFCGERPVVRIEADRSLQIDGTYDLENFDKWYEQALGPFGSQGRGQGMFEETITLGQYPDGKKMLIGRFIAGLDYAKGTWVRPKPPWSWDDLFDDVPIFIWHFFPSYAFQSHFGSPLSHHYIYNRPVDKTFRLKPEALRACLTLQTRRIRGNKWSTLQSDREPGSHDYWRGFQVFLKKYLNHLFNELG